MDIRALLQFLQIAKDGSFTRAAANLYLAQPTLSKTVHNLEEELGVPLFQKNRQQAELTDYGIKLVELATPIVNDFQSIPTWLHDVENNPSGDVHVGVTPMLAGLYLISQITPFCADYPNINLRFSERGSNDIRAMVEACQCDVGFCMEDDSICNSGLLDAYPLFSKEIVALIPYSNPLSQQERVKVSDLRNEKFNFYTEGHAIKHAVFRRCQEAGFTPKINFISGNSSILINLSEHGSGITILPKPFLSVHKCSNLAVVPFDPIFPWNCCMIVKRGRYQSVATQRFITYMLDYFHMNAEDEA